MAAPSGATPVLGLRFPTPQDNVDVPRDIQALAMDVEVLGFLIGEVRFVAVLATPKGWLPCDGSAVSRTTYAKLYAAIGVVFGSGDGSGTFNVPDLRGRTPVGAGTGSGLTARAIGTRWGVEAVVLDSAALPAHQHSDGTLVVSSHTHDDGTLVAASHQHAVGTLDVGTLAATACSVGTESADHVHAISVAAYSPNPSYPNAVTSNYGPSGDTAGAFGGTGFKSVHWDQAAGVSYANVNHGHSASAGGRSAAHVHAVTMPAHDHPISGSVAATAPDVTGATGAAAPDITGSTGSVGGGGAHDNTPPSIAIPAYIYAGV